MNMLPYLALKALFDKLLMRPFGAARFILKGLGGLLFQTFAPLARRNA